MDSDEKTIYALSTAIGGAICVMRLSGPLCFFVAKEVFRTPKKKKKKKFIHGMMNYGWIYDASRQSFLDEIYLVCFEKKASYTGEDIVEFHCHGSRAILDRLSQILSSFGCIPAGPGEFTKKAFLNGRIGLSQAEAIRELIEADTLNQAQIAIHNLQGNLKSRVESLRESLLNCMAHLEASLDYPEEDFEQVSIKDLLGNLDVINNQLQVIKDSYQRYELLRNGIKIGIIGEPNVGKSSLLNALLKKERAIVTEIAGTTRDQIEESFFYKGIRFILVDTAGIRNSEDIVEKVGISRSIQVEKECSFRLYVFDATKPVKKLQGIYPCFYLFNKSDQKISSQNEKYMQERNFCSRDQKNKIYFISALNQDGLTDFLDGLCEFANTLVFSGCDFYLTSVRQKQAIESAIKALEDFSFSLLRGIPVDVALVDLYEALDFLSQITGKVSNPEIVDRIFEKFCIGK